MTVRQRQECVCDSSGCDATYLASTHAWTATEARVEAAQSGWSYSRARPAYDLCPLHSWTEGGDR